ncbi:MAG TPA: hypothetical protein VFQ24_10505 [Terriglobia bacterium]|nr:hypothetical protein [Terriglobia bacterium]
METAIRQIVDEVPQGCIFDSHFVINQLIKRCSDQYLAFASKFAGGKRATLAAHGQIGMEINKLDGTVIEKIGDAWSETIHTAPGRCTCWRKR